MTQPVSNEVTDDDIPEQPPAVPRITHCIEKGENRLRVVEENENGVRTAKTVLDLTTATWFVGKSVPGDENKTTEIVAIFKLENGDMRAWIRPIEGTDGHKSGLAFCMEVPAQNIACFVKTLPVSILADEIADDEERYLYNPDGEIDPDPAPPALAAATNGAAQPVTTVSTVGEG